MFILVLSNNTVVRNMQFRIKNVWAEPCFCETDNRWFICQTKANKLVKFGYNASTVKVHYRYVWASTQHLAWWPYCSKKDSGLGVERSSACGGGWTYLSLSENLSNGSSFQLVCIFTCSHSLSNVERTSSSPLSTNHHLVRLVFPLIDLNLRLTCICLLLSDVNFARVVVTAEEPIPTYSVFRFQCAGMLAHCSILI